MGDTSGCEHGRGNMQGCIECEEAARARIAELERRLAAHEKLIRKVRAFLESGVDWPDDATFTKADELVCEMLDATEEKR